MRRLLTILVTIFFLVFGLGVESSKAKSLCKSTPQQWQALLMGQRMKITMFDGVAARLWIHRFNNWGPKSRLVVDQVLEARRGDLAYIVLFKGGCWVAGFTISLRTANLLAYGLHQIPRDGGPPGNVIPGEDI